MKDKLSAKDLINTGIYTALYLAVVFAVGMMTCVPMLYPALYFVWPLVGGIPFMLFLTKVKKFGMVSIMSIIVGVFWFMMGYTWTVLSSYIVFGIISDFVFKSGGYRNFKTNVAGYWVFSLAIIGVQLPMWIQSEGYIEGISRMMGEEYTRQLLYYMPPWMGFAAIGIIFAGALCGALTGRKMLKKHFIKAGIA